MTGGGGRGGMWTLNDFFWGDFALMNEWDDEKKADDYGLGNYMLLLGMGGRKMRLRM